MKQPRRLIKSAGATGKSRKFVLPLQATTNQSQQLSDGQYTYYSH